MITEREKQVLERIANGMTDAEIADDLSVSTETVKTHVRKILGTTHARNRTHAVACGIRWGFIK